MFLWGGKLYVTRPPGEARKGKRISGALAGYACVGRYTVQGGNMNGSDPPC